ncbi:synaptic vesicle glycoprotein 2A-like [Bradysia coprophila]|uniref:synaptic vesicle glycoprotein 2A-like n=1 Tax=Bradysia coprophila TaxID=38358 RepID=UPI00187DCBED|nr:synaptic vesicle glycoprotein 2A-like [Bradysia coprophila]
MIKRSYSFEDALALTGFGKFNYILIFLSGSILGASYVDIGGVNLILAISQCELELTNVHKGILSSIGYLGIILSSHLWGYLADTKGRKRIMVPALLMSFIFTVISSTATSFWVLVLFRFLQGICICAPQSIIYAFLGEFHCAKNRARVLLVASVVYSITCLQSPVFGVTILNQVWSFHIPVINLIFRPWRLFLLLCGLSSVLCAIVMLIYIPESPKYTFAQGDEEKTLLILQTMFVRNTGKSASEYEVKSIEKDKEFVESVVQHSNFFKFMWTQTVPLFKRPHLRNTLTACFLQFTICITSNGFYTFFPEILNKVYLWLDGDPMHVTSTVCQIIDHYGLRSNSSEMATCLTKLEPSTFVNVTIVILLHLVGWSVIAVIINRTGKLIIIVFIMFGGATCSLLLVFIEIPMVSVYLYTLLLATGMNMSVVNSSTVELFPTSLRATAISISMMTGRLGSIVGSNVVGLALNNFCKYTWLIPAAFLTASGCLAFTIPNINKRNK